MHRRDFIKALSGGFAASVAIPFLPVLVPSRAPQGLMFHPDAFALVMDELQRGGNTFSTPQWVINEFATRMTNNVNFLSRMDLIYGWPKLGIGEPRIGQTIKVRVPWRYQ